MKYAREILESEVKELRGGATPKKCIEELDQAISALEKLENPDELVEKYADMWTASEQIRKLLYKFLKEIKGEGE